MIKEKRQLNTVFNISRKMHSIQCSSDQSCITSISSVPWNLVAQTRMEDKKNSFNLALPTVQAKIFDPLHKERNMYMTRSTQLF